MVSSKSAPTEPTKNRGTWLADMCIGLCCCLLSNTVVLGAVWFGANRMTSGDGEPTGSRTLLQSMLGFDGEHYRAIARRGYDYRPHQRSTVAFFPVYPLAAVDFAIVTGVPIELALLLVPNIAFAGALFLLAAYCRLRWPTAPKRLPWLIVLCCALFPAGPFFHMAYSESCFLLLSVAAFYALERRWPAAITATIVGLATAARPTGVALLAPLAIHLWQGRASLRARLVAFAVWLPVGCWGLGASMAYQHAAFGNALAFADAQQAWHLRPLVPAAEKARALATLEPLRAVYDRASPVWWGRNDWRWFLSWQFANPVFFVIAWVLIALGWSRRLLRDGVPTLVAAPRAVGASEPETRAPAENSRLLTAAEASFSALLLFIPYVTRAYEMGMGSMGRFVSVAFPIYLVVGHLLSRSPNWLRLLAFAGMALYLAVFSARYAARHLVF